MNAAQDGKTVAGAADDFGDDDFGVAVDFDTDEPLDTPHNRRIGAYKTNDGEPPSDQPVARGSQLDAEHDAALRRLIDTVKSVQAGDGALADLRHAMDYTIECFRGPSVLPPPIAVAEFLNPPVLDFVLPGLVRGDVGLLVGRGAIGKSMLALQIAISVALGAPVAEAPAQGTHAGQALWSAPKRGAVAVLFGEDSRAVIANRGHDLYSCFSDFERTVLDDPKQCYVTSVRGLDLRVVLRSASGYLAGPFRDQIEQAATGRRLLIIDPLAFLHDCDEKDNGAMTYLMRQLAQIAEKTNCAIVVIHHTRKPGKDGGDEADDVRGASGISTAARVVYSLRKLTPDEAAEENIESDRADFWLRLAVTKANYIPPQKPRLLQRLLGGLLAFGGEQKPPRAKPPRPGREPAPPRAGPALSQPESRASRLARLTGSRS